MGTLIQKDIYDKVYNSLLPEQKTAISQNKNVILFSMPYAMSLRPAGGAGGMITHVLINSTTARFCFIRYTSNPVGLSVEDSIVSKGSTDKVEKPTFCCVYYTPYIATIE